MTKILYKIYNLTFKENIAILLEYYFIINKRYGIKILICNYLQNIYLDSFDFI